MRFFQHFFPPVFAKSKRMCQFSWFSCFINGTCFLMFSCLLHSMCQYLPNQAHFFGTISLIVWLSSDPLLFSLDFRMNKDVKDTKETKEGVPQENPRRWFEIILKTKYTQR